MNRKHSLALLAICTCLIIGIFISADRVDLVDPAWYGNDAELDAAEYEVGEAIERGEIPQPVSLSPAKIERLHAGLNKRDPNAGVWVVYKGHHTAENLDQPWISGVMVYDRWQRIYQGKGKFNYANMDDQPRLDR